jgi:3-dehydroquinate synthase
MHEINAGSYSVFFNEHGTTELNRLLAAKNYSKVFILTDTLSNECCLDKFLPTLETISEIEVIEIENGEYNKTIETCVSVWSILADFGADRKSVIINLGGGVVTDLGGFVASTFMRGIDFINIPTTLLAMVDASIGGKNGVDLGHLKNQVGTITNPSLVLINTVLLETLPADQMRSGLAEMLKHGLIYNVDYWNKFLDLTTLDLSDLDMLIYESVLIKNVIVTQDHTENGIRKALNFGHTLGHAIESLFLHSHKAILHGEAVAAGMILESHLSLSKGLISNVEYLQIKQLIKGLFGTLPLSGEDQDKVVQLLAHDKKNEYGNIRFALLRGIGNIQIDETADNELIYSAFEDYNS